MVNHRNALMTLWKDHFSVIEYHPTENTNGSTGLEEVVVVENMPCKLSFDTLNIVDQDDTAKIVQIARLFCANELLIKAGSKIVVTRGDRIFEYKQSGESAIFHSHQEIKLMPFKEYA